VWVETPKAKGRVLDVIYSPDSGLDEWDHRGMAAYFVKRGDAQLKCFPSLDTIERETAAPRKRIMRAIAALEAATGAVRLQVRRGCRKDGPGRAVNVYTLIVDLSAADALKSAREQSAASALKSEDSRESRNALRNVSGTRDLSADLSVESGRPECQNVGELSADVGTGSLTKNSYKEFSQDPDPRVRASGPFLKKVRSQTPEQREQEQQRLAEQARQRGQAKLAQWNREHPDQPLTEDNLRMNRIRVHDMVDDLVGNKAFRGKP
jgi:hypothetical protein